MSGRTNLAVVDPDPSWRDHAACKGKGRLFFPVRTPDLFDLHDPAYAPAKAICARCPVKPECLAYALANFTIAQHGVHGGLSPAELRREVRSR